MAQIRREAKRVYKPNKQKADKPLQAGKEAGKAVSGMGPYIRKETKTIRSKRKG